jgi:hypothetical protein
MVYVPKTSWKDDDSHLRYMLPYDKYKDHPVKFEHRHTLAIGSIIKSSNNPLATIFENINPTPVNNALKTMIWVTILSELIATIIRDSIFNPTNTLEQLKYTKWLEKCPNLPDCCFETNSNYSLY